MASNSKVHEAELIKYILEGAKRLWPQLNITEKDLKNCTFEFTINFYRMFIQDYFIKLTEICKGHYQYEVELTNDDTIKIYHHLKEIFKDFPFTYMDITAPTRKCTLLMFQLAVCTMSTIKNCVEPFQQVFQRTVLDKKEEYQSLTKQIAFLRENLKRVTIENGNAMETMEDAKAQCEVARQKYEEMEENQTKRSDEDVKEVEKLSSECNFLEQKYKMLKEEENNLSKKLVDKEEYIQLLNRLKMLKEEDKVWQEDDQGYLLNLRMKVANTALLEKLTDLTSNIDFKDLHEITMENLQKNCDLLSLKNQLKLQSEELNSLNVEKVNLESKIKELEREHGSEVLKYKTEIDQVKAEIFQLDADVHKARLELGENSVTKNKLKADLETVTSKNDEVTGKLKQFEDYHNKVYQKLLNSEDELASTANEVLKEINHLADP